MDNYWALQLFEVLDKKEKKRFLLFLKSPYHNRNQRLVTLCEYLLKVDKKGQERSKEEIFQLLFGKEMTYGEQKLYDQLSLFFRLLQEFLALEGFLQDSHEADIFLLKALAQKNQEDHFNRVFSRRDKKQQKNPFRDSDWYWQQYYLARQATEFFGRKQARRDTGHLSNALDSLDTAYLAQRLKLSCEAINRANILNLPPQSRQINYVQSLIQLVPEEQLQLPVLHIYHQIFLTLTEPDVEAHFEVLVNLLNQHSSSFPKQEVTDMFTYAQNYCILKINQGKSHFHASLFHLFQDLLDKELLIENGELDHRKYKNIVTVGLRMKAYEWVRQFLDDYRPLLSAKYGENAYMYNLAALFYESKDFHQALKLLNQVSYTDVFYHLSAKAMMLKIYFDQDEDVALESLLDTYRIYLNRNQTISAIQRTNHMNLIKFTRKLYRLRSQRLSHSKDIFNQKLQQLQSEVSQTGQIANVNWLQEKLETTIHA